MFDSYNLIFEARDSSPLTTKFAIYVFSRVKECTLLQCFAYGCVGICRVSYFDRVDSLAINKRDAYSGAPNEDIVQNHLT